MTILIKMIMCNLKLLDIIHKQVEHRISSDAQDRKVFTEGHDTVSLFLLAQR